MTARQAGFSLVEILVALMIVGMMLGMGLTALQYINRGRRTTTETRLNAIKFAITEFLNDTTNYPASLEELHERPADQRIAKSWKGAYIEDEKTFIDGWGSQFQYTLLGKQHKPPYELYSFGKDGEGSDPNTWVHAQ